MENIGEKDKRIVIEVNTPTKDGDAGLVPSWATHVSAWASVKPIGSGEGPRSSAIRSITKFEMRMWYQAGVTQAMRVSWDSRYFDIEGLHHDTLEGELILTAAERKG